MDERNEDYDIYGSFACVYDKFMDNVPYKEWGKYLKSLLEEQGISDGLVLELGCGTGSLTEILADAGYDMIGTLRFAERTVEDSMVSDQIERDVRALVDHLPAEQREVVMLRYFSGLSFKDIAEQTDVSINTALGRMRYALINLRRMIKEKNLILS